MAIYKEKEQLMKFLKLVNVELTPFLSRQTESDGLVEVLKPTREFHIEKVSSPKEYPNGKNVKQARGIVMGSLVDMVLDVQESTVTLYKPKPLCFLNGFNATKLDSIQTHKFFKENGTLKKM
ncbi:hypothetical protein P4493_05970 [Bacillus thuringiensis]|nr:MULTISPECIES: hypothetical protein [Bacillus]EAO55623.1 hypothetical protein RBTH_06759 [Bacillus thuringiensis serovar israelensis ATCC 35646]EEM74481.1 hypothetical protein bthur0010_55080 [Bacillus thuringiensis serovar pondicheriensis BGSC 4BA1]EEN00058.1 hypothetical protein bthur0014_55530 [Bacillus thuringiensis IBL 4222]KRD80968.1 hypothetical protein ASE53_18160 [Bacillus sp. Root11]KRD85498.1 hypothetical protein ASE54_18165 [Bacillus sp. Root131]OTX61278.1 hypothetical protein B